MSASLAFDINPNRQMNENEPNTVFGTQWVADFAGCRCASNLLTDAAALELACMTIVAASGLKIMGRVFHQFSPVGATGLVLLAESHLAVHTWPEFSSVAIDLYVCNVYELNTDKAKAVFDQLVSLFQPASNTHKVILRGSAQLQSSQHTAV